jgi:hypothetical protein
MEKRVIDGKKVIEQIKKGEGEFRNCIIEGGLDIEGEDIEMLRLHKVIVDGNINIKKAGWMIWK